MHLCCLCAALNSLCKMHIQWHLDLFKSTSVMFWVVKIEKKKKYYPFIGCTCTWMCFSFHQFFYALLDLLCLLLFHLMLLFYYLVPRITVDKVFCWSVIFSTHIPSCSLGWMTFWGLFISIYIWLLYFIPQKQLIMSGFHRKLSAALSTEPKHKTDSVKVFVKKTKCLLHGNLMVSCCFAERQTWLWNRCLLVKDWNPNSMTHSHYSYWPVDSHRFTV